MAGITDIGNGIGYVYKTDPTGTDILGYEPNTKQGVRSMQQQGVTNAPIVGNRSSVGTITFTACNGVGNVTGVVINGISQIGANVPCTTTNVDDLAQDVANAINSWTAAGNPYTALAFGGGTGLVYVYSSPEFGTSTNGLTITVSVDDPSITFTTTPFADGSSEVGVNDSVLGYKFYIDSSLAAVPDSIVGAVDITVYMTQRGMQVGMAPVDEIINNDTLFNINRTSTFTIVNVDTEGAALTDTLAQIDPQNFIEGDIIFLRQENPARSITVESVTGTTTALTPNIKLANDIPFITDQYNTLMLQLKYVSTNTLYWVEVSRSTANAQSFISINLSGFNALAAANNLVVNAVYFITDLLDGTFVTTYSQSDINTKAQAYRYVPKSYAGVWQTNMATPVAGSRYRYYQKVYESLTGSIGTAPSGDPVNWQEEATSTTYYSYDLREVTLAFRVGVGIATAWPILGERDRYNNDINQSAVFYTNSGNINAYTAFSWQSASSPVKSVEGNYVFDGIFECVTSNTTIIRNSVTNGAIYKNNLIRNNGAISGNIFAACTVDVNNLINIANNVVQNGSVITLNGTSTAALTSIVNCNLQGGRISGNVSDNPAATGGSIQFCTIERGGIEDCIIRNGNLISGCNIVGENARLYSCNVNISIGVSQGLKGIIVRGFGDVTITHASSGTVSDVLFENTNATITTTAGFSGGVFSNNNSVTWTNATTLGFGQYSVRDCLAWSANGPVDLQNISGSQTGTVFDYQLAAGTWQYGIASNNAVNLDLDDPTIWAGSVLTIPSQYGHVQYFTLKTVGVKSINSIVNHPDLTSCFWYADVSNVDTITFAVTGTVTGGIFIRGAANATLDVNNNVSDIVETSNKSGATTIMNNVVCL